MQLCFTIGLLRLQHTVTVIVKQSKGEFRKFISRWCTDKNPYATNLFMQLTMQYKLPSQTFSIFNELVTPFEMDLPLHRIKIAAKFSSLLAYLSFVLLVDIVAILDRDLRTSSYHWHLFLIRLLICRFVRTKMLYSSRTSAWSIREKRL